MQALARLRRDLERIDVVELSAPLVERVHALVARHPLRASDALHLAAALLLRDAAGLVELVGYDERLVVAARAEGFSVLP